MATKRTKVVKTPPVASDLEILAPDREMMVDDEKITVRELAFGDQLAQAARLSAVADAIKPLLAAGDLRTDQALDALSKVAEDIVALIAVSTGKTAEWVRSRSGGTGEQLMLLWWQVNQHFFIRRLVLYPLLDEQARKQAAISPGGASSLPLSATATNAAN
jgi:hypothetical protein